MSSFPSSSPAWRRLTLTHSQQDQIRVQKNEIKSFYQFNGRKKLQLRGIGLRRRPMVDTANGGRKLMSKKNGHFRISGGKLFFNACYELLSTRESNLQSHVQETEKLVQSMKREVTFGEALKADKASCGLYKQAPCH